MTDAEQQTAVCMSIAWASVSLAKWAKHEFENGRSVPEVKRLLGVALRKVEEVESRL